MSTLIDDTFSLLGDNYVAIPDGRAAFTCIGFLLQTIRGQAPQYRFFLGDPILLTSRDRGQAIYSPSFTEEMHDAIARRLNDSREIGNDAFYRHLKQQADPLDLYSYLEILAVIVYFTEILGGSVEEAVLHIRYAPKLRPELDDLLSKITDPEAELVRRASNLRTLLLTYSSQG